MDARRQETVEAVRATDFLLGRDEWGATLDRRVTARSWRRGGRRRVSARASPTGRAAASRPRPARLRAGRRRGKEARVPAGTTLFDAASWNGIAIDSTCGGHGTCKKCKVRVVTGNPSLSPVDPRAFAIEELKAGWRLACRAQAEEDIPSPCRRSRRARRRRSSASAAT